MSALVAKLPAGFAALEPFVEAWSAPGCAARAQARDASSEAERLAFYHAAAPVLAEALAYLDRKPLAELERRETRLMNLMLSLAHVALAVEAQGDDEPKHARARQFLRITRSPADQI